MINEEREISISIQNFEIAVEATDYNLMSLLHPTVSLDGDKFCVLYGDNLMEGISGFGDTPYDAVLDFNASWHKKALEGE